MTHGNPNFGLWPEPDDHDPFAPCYLPDPCPLWRLSQREAAVACASKADLRTVPCEAEIRSDTHFCIGGPPARELAYPASPASHGVERLQLEWTA